MSHNQRGISLIEVLVSMTLISVTLLTLMKAHLYLQQHSQYAHHVLEAQALADNQLQSWRMWQLAATDESMWSQWGSGYQQVGDYQMRWQVQSHLGDLVRQVDITVSWQERNGASQSITLQSQLSRAGHVSL